MVRPLSMASAGGIGALLAWLVSEPFAPTAARDGVRVGSTMFSLGSFYGWFAHGLLGALIVGFIAITVNVHRSKLPRTILFGLIGLVLGGFLGWISDATSDRLMISMLRSQGDSLSSQLVPHLFWNFAVAMSLAIGVGLSCQPTGPRLLRVAVGGVVAAILGFFARMFLEPVMAIVALSRAGVGGRLEPWQPFDVARLADDLLMGIVLGLAISLAERVLTSGTLRLVVGRNEGREFRLGAGANRVGSAEGIEVPIFDRSLLPVHAVVYRQGGQFHVQDQGGGTLLDGHPIQLGLLHDGAVLQVGNHTLVFRARGSPYPPPHFYSPPAAASASPKEAVRHCLTDVFGNTFELAEGPNGLGRDPGQAVSLPHEASVSRSHAMIAIHCANATIRDLGSTNGTLANDVKLTGELSLVDGDRVALGRAALTYRMRPDIPSRNARMP